MHWVRYAEGWRHRPPWKVAINTILRAVQPQRVKFVVFTIATEHGDPPTAIGYGFGPVEHASPPTSERLIPRVMTAIQVAAITAIIWSCRRTR